MESYWNMHIPGVVFASNNSPIQNLVLTNSKLKQKIQSLKCTKKIKKSGFSKCKIKTLNRFSSNYNTLCDGSNLFKKLTLFSVTLGIVIYILLIF